MNCSDIIGLDTNPKMSSTTEISNGSLRHDQLW